MSRWPGRRRDAAQRKMHCMQVVRVLQSYLDGQTDEANARRVAAHLSDCRRCGLEAAVYREIKNSLARHETPTAEAAARLRAFGASLSSGNRGEGTPGADGEPPAGA